MNDERVEEWAILMGQFTRYQDFIFYLVRANGRRGIDVKDRAFSNERHRLTPKE